MKTIKGSLNIVKEELRSIVSRSVPEISVTCNYLYNMINHMELSIIENKELGHSIIPVNSLECNTCKYLDTINKTECTLGYIKKHSNIICNMYTHSKWSLNKQHTNN